MCRSMKPLEWGFFGDEVVCLMPKPERNLANSLLLNGGPLSETISLGYPSIEKNRLDGPLMTRMMFLLCKGKGTSRNSHRLIHTYDH